MKKQLLVLSVIVVLLQGCAMFDGFGNIDKAIDYECIPPMVTFAYPVNQGPRSPSLEVTLPLPPWKIEIVLPLPDPNSGVISDRIMFARSVNGNTEIWVVRDSDRGQGNINSSLLIYNTGDKEWHEIPNAFGNISPSINKLYLNQGHIWAVSTWPKMAFGVYDEKESTFKLLDLTEPVPEGYFFFDDNKGMFWIFESFGAIYSMDPLSPRVIRHVEIPEIDVFINGVAFAPDGSIYGLYSLVSYVDSKNDLGIFQYDPLSNNTENIYNPSYEQTLYFNLFVDRSGNLWLDDHTWRTPDDIWYEVVRSPVFITDKYDTGFTYQWAFPQIILESSDNRLWFRSINGMVSLDPEKGEWCWFTTERSNIVEDQDHNLWMIADGKLYRYQLEP